MKQKNPFLAKLLTIGITIILIVALYGSLSLSITEYKSNGICPKMVGIPACYLVMIFFTIGFIAHLGYIFRKPLIFYLPITLVFLMALRGTLTELSGVIVCPRTSSGTPMCYISLAICSTLLILKTIELIVNKNYNRIK